MITIWFVKQEKTFQEEPKTRNRKEKTEEDEKKNKTE